LYLILCIILTIKQQGTVSFDEKIVFNKIEKISFEEEKFDDFIEFEWNLKNKNKPSRRCSVFSKTIDPEVDFISQESMIIKESIDEQHEFIDLIEENAYEVMKNTKFEGKQTLKTDDQREQIKKVLYSIVIFKHLYEEEINKIIDSMFERPCTKDEIIIREGDSGYYFYIILNGVYEIFIKGQPFDANDQNKMTTQYKEYIDKGFFGELSLLYDQVN
jgi:hypothetical protein